MMCSLLSLPRKAVLSVSFFERTNAQPVRGKLSISQRVCTDPVNILEHMTPIRVSLQGTRPLRHPAMHVSPAAPSYDKEQATTISLHKSLKKRTHAHRLLLERVQRACHLERIKKLPFILQPRCPLEVNNYLWAKPSIAPLISTWLLS